MLRKTVTLYTHCKPDFFRSNIVADTILTGGLSFLDATYGY